MLQGKLSTQILSLENASDQGRLFGAAKKLLSKKEAPSFPNYLDKTTLTNDIGRFFIHEIKTIRSNIDANSRTAIVVLDDPEVVPDKELRTSQPLNEEQGTRFDSNVGQEILPVRSCTDVTCGFVSGHTSPNYHVHD